MLLHVIYLIAIVAEAMSGAIAGMRREMDLFGMCLIGCVTALGGGTIRDLLLGHYPLGWVAHPEYLAYAAFAAVVTAVLVNLIERLHRVFLLVDALGLVTFTVIGCNVAHALGVHPGIVIVAGMVTGVFGGLLRDVLCNEIPLVLRHELYASVSLATGALYMGLLEYGVHQDIATLSAIIAGFALRMLAVRFGWRLPRYGPPEASADSVDADQKPRRPDPQPTAADKTTGARRRKRRVR